jgi:replicative DNA helicase
MRLTQAQIATFEQEVIGQLFLMMESTGKTHELMPYTMKLQPSDFTLELTREIYSYICSQVAKGEAFGIVSADEYLSRILHPESYSFGLLASLCQNVVSYASINTLVTKLRNESKRRKLLALVESSKMEILAAEDIDAAVAGAESMMASLRAGTDITDTLKPISAVGAEYIRQTIDEVENPDKHAGLDTGFSGLDKLLGRKKMVRGSLAVVAGRPAMGKTSVMLSILLHAAKRPNAGACIAFSQEMPNVQLFDRIVKQETGIQDDDFNHAFDRTCDTIVAFQSRSQGLQIYMDDQPRQSIDKIKQRARLVAKKQKLDIILVDYLGIMEMPKADRHDISISLITTELKALAKELNCVVVLLSQVNRDCEKRQNKRPTNSDLKDSGAIEQDADYIIFLYRDSVYDEKSIARDYAELIMSKNRHGQIGTAYAAFKNGAYLDTDQATAYNVCSQVVEKPASRL